MSGILFVVGALASVVGVAMVGFGIPDKEFSFGNTLIQAGVTAVVGGLIIVALGFVVLHLQRLAEALTAKSPIRSTRPMDMFDTARAGRVPFPAKPKSEMPAQEMADHADHGRSENVGTSDFAPALRNPEETHVTVEDDVSLSPRHGEHEETGHDAPAPGHHEADVKDHQDEAPDAGWRPAPRANARPVQSAYFDAMWPSETKDAPPASPRSESDYKPFEPKRFEPKPFEPKPLFDPKPYEPKYDAPKFEESKVEEHYEEPAPEPEPELPAVEPVAILKSGVVDGMAYTLYVDGSIEAELPQGTLRFASINELRAHLEKSA